MTYKPYKMGGPSLYRSAPGKYAAPLKQAKVTETWEEPTTTTTVKKNDKGGENTTVNTNQKGKKTTTTQNKDLTTFKNRCAKYNKTNSAAAKADGCVWAKGKSDPKDDVKTEPLSKSDTKTTSTEKKEKVCKCRTYKADGSEGPMVTHECGNKNPNCSKRPTTKKCSCTPPGSDKAITHDCDKPKPSACASKGSTPGCPDSKRQSCPGSSWSFKKCKCLKRPNDNKSSGRVKKRCFKGSKLADCIASDGGKGPKGGGRTM